MVIRRVAIRFFDYRLGRNTVNDYRLVFLSAICGFAQRKTDNAGYGTFDIVLSPYDCVSGHTKARAI